LFRHDRVYRPWGGSDIHRRRLSSGKVETWRPATTRDQGRLFQAVHRRIRRQAASRRLSRVGLTGAGRAAPPATLGHGTSPDLTGLSPSSVGNHGPVNLRDPTGNPDLEIDVVCGYPHALEQRIPPHSWTRRGSSQSPHVGDGHRHSRAGSSDVRTPGRRAGIASWRCGLLREFRLRPRRGRSCASSVVFPTSSDTDSLWPVRQPVFGRGHKCRRRNGLHFRRRWQCHTR
jgi:hypothetical protein